MAFYLKLEFRLQLKVQYPLTQSSYQQALQLAPDPAGLEVPCWDLPATEAPHSCPEEHGPWVERHSRMTASLQ